MTPDTCLLHGFCKDHPTLVAALDEIRENTRLIIQTLHGRLGDGEPGLVADIRELDTRVTRLEATQTLVTSRAWDLFIRLAPWFVTGALFAFQFYQQGFGS